jgi:NADH:ubiquinone oxidoreductase subunit 5 (subunit L)/multisubunit Na+/H+ antiporter MnhA subunit
MKILSVGFFCLPFLHQLTDSLFKALVFVCSGVIFDTTNNAQDIRFMGDLSSTMPSSSVR